MVYCVEYTLRGVSWQHLHRVVMYRVVDSPHDLLNELLSVYVPTVYTVQKIHYIGTTDLPEYKAYTYWPYGT